jgi:hypothetical protein
MNFIITEQNTIEKKGKVICDDLKKATKNLELLIKEEKAKKQKKYKKNDKKFVNTPHMPPAGITSQRYAQIDNHLETFINSLRN